MGDRQDNCKCGEDQEKDLGKDQGQGLGKDKLVHKLMTSAIKHQVSILYQLTRITRRMFFRNLQEKVLKIHNIVRNLGQVCIKLIRNLEN